MEKEMEKENDLLKRVPEELLKYLEKDNEWYQKYTSQEILEFERLTGLKVYALEVHDKDGEDKKEFTIREWEKGEFLGLNYIEPRQRSVLFIAPPDEDKVRTTLIGMKNYWCQRATPEFKVFLEEYGMNDCPELEPSTSMTELDSEECCQSPRISIKKEDGILLYQVKWTNCYCS